MTHTQDLTTGPEVYQIRVKGHLGSRWRRWFEPMTITPHANGDTLLKGPAVDQAALHAVLTRLRDLGVPLISITRIDVDGSDTSSAKPYHIPTTSLPLNERRRTSRSSASELLDSHCAAPI